MRAQCRARRRSGVVPAHAEEFFVATGGNALDDGAAPDGRHISIASHSTSFGPARALLVCCSFMFKCAAVERLHANLLGRSDSQTLYDKVCCMLQTACCQSAQADRFAGMHGFLS